MIGRRLALVTVIAVVGGGGVWWSMSPAPPQPEPGKARALVWFDANGAQVAEVGSPAAAWTHLWFDDTEQLVFGVVEGSTTIWMVDLGTGLVRPAGRPLDAVTDAGDRLVHVGTTHAVIERTSDARPAIPSLWVYPVGALTDARLFPAPEIPAARGRFSVDQRWLAYVSHESGTPEVYITTFPDPESRWLVSSPEGGTRPVWRSDSLELYYWAPGGHLMRAPLKRGNRFVQPGLSTAVFARPDLADAPFAVTRDGTRFLVAVPR